MVIDGTLVVAMVALPPVAPSAARGLGAHAPAAPVRPLTRLTLLAGRVRLLNATIPALTELRAVAFLGERLGSRGRAGIAVDFLGSP